MVVVAGSTASSDRADRNEDFGISSGRMNVDHFLSERAVTPKCLEYAVKMLRKVWLKSVQPLGREKAKREFLKCGPVVSLSVPNGAISATGCMPSTDGAECF